MRGLIPLKKIYILMPELMAQKDPVAAAAQRYKPIQSAVPGTTLGPIQINAFLGGGVCHCSRSLFLFTALVIFTLVQYHKNYSNRF